MSLFSDTQYVKGSVVGIIGKAYLVLELSLQSSGDSYKSIKV